MDNNGIRSQGWTGPEAGDLPMTAGTAAQAGAGSREFPALAGGHFGDFDLDAKLDLAQHGVEA